ncbi:MAG: glycosyltransferase [Terrimicrobiaceae bacterium]|nr:glycosyltransferase [Terrimicrobiaceae bacterium]
MAVRRVLILTAGFGEGHNAAARNLRDALAVEDAAAEVEMRDVFLEAYGWANRLAVRGYLLLINRLPGVWNLVFRWLDRSNAVCERIGIFGRAARRMRALLHEMEPGVVVSTYPGYNHLLDHLYARSSRRPFQQVTIVTDSLTINRVWHTGHSDWYLAANEETAAVMRSQGVPAEKLRVTGFPVPAFFSEVRASKVAPPPGAPWRVLFMVNAGKCIAVEAVRRLLSIEGIDLTVTVGRDMALEQRIRALGGGAKVHGWADELPRMMADAHIVVSKAGGATVQECLAACTPMIVSQVVPGQEEGNARLISGSGAGVIAETPEAIAQAVRDACADGGAVWKGWYAAVQRLSRPHAARDIAQWILKLNPS